MITGDHPATALAIAKQAGIKGDEALTGAELEGLDQAQFEARLAKTNVFARIMPEQKLRLVQAFAASGEIVAMTGDGVNDAPSLKAAHIGVAMGGRGTDVAREAASLVLLDDNFASLVTAVRLGRRIADNLRKAMGYILAVHVPIAGMSLLPVLFGWPMVLGPIHVVFLELVIDPVSSIVFEAEPEEDGLMARPPRKPDAPLFDAPLLLHGLLQGAVVMVAALGIFQLGIGDAHGEEVARCMAFVTLVIGNLGLVLTNRSMKTKRVPRADATQSRPGLRRHHDHGRTGALAVRALVARTVRLRASRTAAIGGGGRRRAGLHRGERPDRHHLALVGREGGAGAATSRLTDLALCARRLSFEQTITKTSEHNMCLSNFSKPFTIGGRRDIVTGTINELPRARKTEHRPRHALRIFIIMMFGMYRIDGLSPESMLQAGAMTLSSGF